MPKHKTKNFSFRLSETQNQKFFFIADPKTCRVHKGLNSALAQSAEELYSW